MTCAEAKPTRPTGALTAVSLMYIDGLGKEVMWEIGNALYTDFISWNN